MYKTKIRNILMAALILLCFLVCGILYSNTGVNAAYAIRRIERVYGRQNQTTENERERSILFFACRTEEDRAGGVVE